jgi:tape measure domain-containing protein
MSNTGNNTSWFASGIDNSRMRIDAQEIRNLLRGVGNSAEAESSRIDSAFKKAGAAVAGYFTINSVQSFIRQIVQVRGEIESLEISFQTLLGSKTKADELFSSIRKFATETPLELAPLAKGAQTLLGFNIEAEKVMPILKQIGDISMGNADRFNSLVLAFSQMSSVGKLMGQDLLQMINAGFNPLQEMSIRTGKSISELKEQMSAGAITSEQVAAAFASAAGEGGKFYGMLEKQSKGIQGSISNLNGAIDDMLNDLGTKSQGIITSAISGATIIVENYEKIGSAIADIVVAYGAYKAALITLNTVQAIQTQMRVAHIALVRQEIAANAGATAAEIRTIVAKKSLTGALIQQTAAQIKANLVALANPYVLVAAAVAALAFGIYKLVTAETAAEAAQRKHNEAMQAAKEKKRKPYFEREPINRYY